MRIGDTGHESGDDHRLSVFRGQMVVRLIGETLDRDAKLGEVFVRVLANSGQSEK